MNRMKSHFLMALLLMINSGYSIVAQTKTPREVVNFQIRDEVMKRSQIMRTLHYFTDIYGPRLTGSPTLEQAGKWAMNQMDEWGVDKTYVEPWDWGNVGWENDRASGFIISPLKDHLTFEVLAWTPSTKGIVKADVVRLNLPRGVNTKRKLDVYFEQARGKIIGKIVLVGSPRKQRVNFRPPRLRSDSALLKRQFVPRKIEDARRSTRRSPARPKHGILTRSEATDLFNKFLVDSGVLVRINDAGRQHGQIRAFANRTYDPTKTVPTVVMRNEDFGRISRILDDEQKVELEFSIRNSVYPKGKTAYNVIGEIEGSDKKDEVIMLGGHLDSWHSATGATDNAIGCAVMLEAVRILKAIGIKPRRTIRVALWSGEEQGLLGSRAYVAKHFGSYEQPKPAFYKFGGYFNIDSGTGRARGMSVFGPIAAAEILKRITAPFSDLSFVGVRNGASRRLGGSDYTSFNQAGLPGISVVQDRIEYFSHTWHTNLDTYERIVEDDAKASAAVIAAAVYELAMRDELLPRLNNKQMPDSTIVK